MSRLTIEQIDIVDRSFAAAGVTSIGVMLINLTAVLYQVRGPHIPLLWALPPFVAALVFYRAPLDRMLATVGLWLVVLPAAMATDVIAHLFGYCLQ